MLRLRTLGELRLTGPAGDLLRGRRKELVLLAYLAQRAPRAVHRAELVDLLWGEREEERARHSLRQALLMLRRTVGEGLMIAPQAVTLGSDVVELDLALFDAAVTGRRLREAVELWGGDFLFATEDVGGEAYRLWMEAERERARRRLRDALESLVAGAEAAADRQAAIAWAEWWTELLPLDEQACHRLVEALYLDGRTGAAQARHAEYTVRLRRELGVDPSPALVRLGERIAAPEVPEPSSLGRVGSAALFTPDLVGRDAAGGELRDAWQVSAGGGAVVVVVEGGEGMGKTMLCEALLHAIEERSDPSLRLQARAREEESAPGTAARELVAGLAAASGLSNVPDADLAELARLVPSVRDVRPWLPEPQGGEAALHRAVVRVLAAVACESPVLLFLDDFPLADGESRRLIAALARHPPAGVLLLLTVRTDGDAAAAGLGELRAVPGLRRIKLPPLGVADVEALAGSMLELPAAERRHLAARLHAETGGNPFYASEIIGAMVDEGQLAPDARGIWRINPSLGGGPLPLPSSIRDAIARRIARLGDAARHVAATAAALPEPIDPASLAARSGLPPTALQAGVDELLARRLLRYAPGRPDALEFAHPIIHRVAYDGSRRTRHPALPLRRRSGRPLALVGATIVAALVIGAAVLRWTAGRRPLPTLAVGQITEHGGADSFDLALPMGGMLAVNLARVPGLTAISSARIHEVVGQLGSVAGMPASAAGAARHAGADQLLDGALHREPGGRLRLALRRVDLRTGAVRGEYTVTGADPFALVDSATARVAGALGLRPPVLRVADVTTSSLAGYGLYEQGLRSYGVGDYGRALPLFEAALAEDSLFAMAAFSARNAAVVLGRPAPSPSLERLDSLAARAADRERLLIRASVANVLHDPSVAALAESLTARYPAEPEGHLLLGAARMHDGDFLGALPHLNRVVAMDSLGLRAGRLRCLACEAIGLMADVYSRVDSFPAAERVTREWIRLQPGAREAWRWLGLVLAAQGRYDEGAAALHTAAAASRPDVPALAAFLPLIVRIQAGDFAAADRALVELVRTGPPDLRQEARWYLVISLRNQGRLREAMAHTREFTARAAPGDQGGALLAAQILFESGRVQEAAQIFDSLAAFPPPSAVRGVLARHKSWMLVHLATSQAARGDTAAVEALLEPLRAWGTRSSYGRDRRLFHHANGLLLVATGRLEEAAAEFRRAIYSLTLGYTRTNYELARTVLALGRPREAVAVLQPALRGPVDGSNLYVTRTDLHELLGRAHEAAGEPDSAAAHFRAVLAAWRNADRAFHLRRDAIRERLAVLGRTRGSTH